MAKKSFKDNPALQFISTTEEEPLTAATTEKPPKGYKVNPLYVETKSRRLQLILQPSLYARVKAQAKAEGISVNECCHRILDEATGKEQ